MKRKLYKIVCMALATVTLMTSFNVTNVEAKTNKVLKRQGSAYGVDYKAVDRQTIVIQYDKKVKKKNCVLVAFTNNNDYPVRVDYNIIFKDKNKKTIYTDKVGDETLDYFYIPANSRKCDYCSFDAYINIFYSAKDYKTYSIKITKVVKLSDKEFKEKSGGDLTFNNFLMEDVLKTHSARLQWVALNEEKSAWRKTLPHSGCSTFYDIEACEIRDDYDARIAELWEQSIYYEYYSNRSEGLNLYGVCNRGIIEDDNRYIATIDPNDGIYSYDEKNPYFRVVIGFKTEQKKPKLWVAFFDKDGYPLSLAGKVYGSASPFVKVTDTPQSLVIEAYYPKDSKGNVITPYEFDIY